MANLVPTDFKGAKVFVTGATGLVGSSLINKLLEIGASVFTLESDMRPSYKLLNSDTSRKITSFFGDLANIRDVKKACVESEAEFVFHLGAQTIVGHADLDPVSTFESNIQGTWNILEAARISNNRIKAIVVASSDKAYGESESLPYTEDHPLLGLNPYDVSKTCTDLLAQSYSHSYKLPIGIARCGNIYGPGDLNWSRIVPGSIKAITEDRKFEIRGNGKNLRDYIFVDDVVDAYLMLSSYVQSHREEVNIFNFSNDRAYSSIEVFHTISEIMLNKKLEPAILNIARNEISDQHLTSAKAKKILSWSSNYELKFGLEKTISWYQNYFNQEKIN